MHAGTQHDQPFLAPPISSDSHIDGILNCRFQKFEYLFVIALRLFRRAFHEIRKHGDEFM